MTINQFNQKERKRLIDYGSNRHSQFGEDGIIEKIFEIIGVRSKVCVEFGAWDGFHLSNTANLWTNGWKGVLIEGHSGRFRQLTANVKDYSCVCIHAYVSRDGDNRLEALLANRQIAPEIDLLSIDIDGNDYYIIESLGALRPRLIVCEYNPTIPADIDMYAEYGNYFGASVTALERMARSKSYRLVALTDTNCFFVLEEDFHKFSGYETRLQEIRIDSSLIHVITAYNGDYVLSRAGPYGVNFPFDGKLAGPHSRIAIRSPLFKPLAALLRQLRNIAKTVVGRNR